MSAEPVEIATLRVLRRAVEDQRAKYMEMMARGLSDMKDYWETVGRAKESKALIVLIDERIEVLSRDGDEEEGDS